MPIIVDESRKVKVYHRIQIRCPHDYVEELPKCGSYGLTGALALARRVAGWLGTDPWSEWSHQVPLVAAEFRAELIERDIDPADCTIEVTRPKEGEDEDDGLVIEYGYTVVASVRIDGITPN